MEHDLFSEGLLSLADAAALIPDGRVTRVRRWATVGVRGIRLESIRVGVGMFTSRPALERFSRRLTAGEMAEQNAAGRRRSWPSPSSFRASGVT